MTSAGLQAGPPEILEVYESVTLIHPAIDVLGVDGIGSPFAA